MKDTKVNHLQEVADFILKQTNSNSPHLLFCIQMAERILRPYQIRYVKDKVLNSIRNQHASVI